MNINSQCKKLTEELSELKNSMDENLSVDFELEFDDNQINIEFTSTIIFLHLS